MLPFPLMLQIFYISLLEGGEVGMKLYERMMNETNYLLKVHLCMNTMLVDGASFSELHQL